MKSSLMLLVALAAMTAGAQDVFIRGAVVHTQSALGTLTNGDVLVRAGKIIAVGSELTVPEDATLVEAAGRPLTPGLFAGLSAIGIDEVSGEADARDSRFALIGALGQRQWWPEFDVSAAFNPYSPVVSVTRMEGLTWTMLAPGAGGSILAGQGSVVSLEDRYDATIGGSRALFVRLGASAASQSGGSRAAQLMLMKQAFGEAREPNSSARDPRLLTEAGRLVLKRYLAGDGLFAVLVNRAADIHHLLTFAREEKIRIVIVGGAEAWRVAAELARANVPVLLNPVQNLPESFDTIAARADNALLLHRAGVRIAFFDHLMFTHNARKLRQLAGNAVAHGLPWEVALAALTCVPAELFGVEHERGRIVPGQVADLVLWSGDPLEVNQGADQVWMSGRAIPMRSRQTELRDRYLPTTH